MNFIAKSTQISKHKTECAIVFAAGKKLLASSNEVDSILGGTLTNLIKQGDFKEDAGASLWIALTPEQSKGGFQRLMIVQLGKPSSDKHTFSKENMSKAIKQIAAKVAHKPFKDVSVFLDDINIEDAINDADSAQWLGQAFAKTLLEKSYVYTTTKGKTKKTTKDTEQKEGKKLGKLLLIGKSASQLTSGLDLGRAVGIGINYARELGNLPGNICTPSYLAEQAKILAKSNTKTTAKILNEKQMETLGMGSLLSVSHGSDEEAKLIVIEYKGKSSGKPIVLVGKGITFDTGGISLKPGSAMDEMKYDMCGSASVLGTMQSLIEFDAKVNVVAVIAAAENMPSGRATKPGDVVTSMSGQTIEVLNTDAEGRLVLCDALTYAEKFKPKAVIDIATLTGACVIALGRHATGLYSNDQDLADALLESGKKTNDKAWQMPLWDDYQSQLDSNFADIANIGGREAGSVTAACFLSRFTKKYSWAHLDIAGTAWVGGAKKGATGRPVSLLFDYVLNAK